MKNVITDDSEMMENGNLSDLPYAAHFSPECSPVQIATAAKARGFRAPDVDRPFSFADLGCGRGRTLLVLASAYPDSRFYGLDLNQDHIHEATQLATRSGLENITFIHGSFASDAARGIGHVDFAVAHGVYTWVSPEARFDLVALLDSIVKPSGLAFVSYYTEAGYAQMLPVRSLLKHLATTQPRVTASRQQDALDTLRRFASSKAPFFEQNAQARSMVEAWRLDDPNYLLHEYFNESWHLVSFSEVSDAMSQSGFRFCGDPALFTRDCPKSVADLIDSFDDPQLREELATFALPVPFRTDVFSRCGPERTDERPVFKENELFGTIWPGQSKTMHSLACRRDNLGAIVALLIDGPMSWEEIRHHPKLGALQERERAAILGRGLATSALARYERPLSSPSSRSVGEVKFSSKMSLQIADDPMMNEPLFFPARRLGGAVPLPSPIAHVIAAASQGNRAETWEDRSTTRFETLSQFGSITAPSEVSGDHRALAQQAIDGVKSVWAPFLLAAGIVEPVS